MDFVIPSEAPGYRISPDEHVRLIPLTMMRRKTLVSFGVADVDGRALSLMSMRHTQALTFEMICVLAEITLGRDHSEEVRQFARLIAFGNQQKLEEAFARAAVARRDHPDSDLSLLMNDDAARRMIRRLADNFVLLVTVEEGSARRIIRFAYDEPVSLRYRHSRFDRSSKTLERVARPAPRKQRLAWIGWEPTAIRFPVPAAEYTLSYHFEVEAPPGAVITEASLIAGRPGVDEASRLSWDYVADRLPVVGLHAVEVPNGSISGVQVLLRPSARGWLFTNALAALLSCLLLAATAVRSLSGEQVQLVTGAIFAISAAFIVFIVQPGEHQMVSRLVAGVRYAMAILIGLLVIAGIAIILVAHTRTLLLLLCFAALTCTILIVAVFWRAQRAKKSIHISPWEQGVDIGAKGRALNPEFASLEDAHARFGFDKPAIIVQTAEAEHLEEPWTENIDRELKVRLDHHRLRSQDPQHRPNCSSVYLTGSRSIR
jgi:hypothetical protein